MIIKTTIVVTSEFNEEDTSEFKALPMPVQTEILTRNADHTRELIVENFPEGSLVDISIEEVGE